jgi:hypothetical protein
MKGHVPEENLPRYRRIMGISRTLDSLGGHLSNLNEYEDANRVWSLAVKYRNMAQELRADVPLIREGDLA